MHQRKELFEFMLKMVKHTSNEHGDYMPQAFGRWFAKMYFSGITEISIPDGSGDGKVDLVIESKKGNKITKKILNTKFTNDYDKPSPVSFYDEITRFWQAFENKSNRHEYLDNAVRKNLKKYYTTLFKDYDNGDVELYFITNHKINQKQYETVKNCSIKIFHLDDVLQYLVDHIEGAMPQTDPLILTGISNVLTPLKSESKVPTSIVFARLIDFIKYMESDSFELLFARNVRLWLGNTETNKGIYETFCNSPKEFAYSNNGITLLCNDHTYNPGEQELLLINPRVVNGSQTLHSIRGVDNPSKEARVMVRIIEVPQIDNNNNISSINNERREIIHKISIRTNMQNPIKKWNLVSTDDFQNELSKYFRNKNYFYERRQNEWNYRKFELKSHKIQKGPDIRWMSQLLSSYYYDKKQLGPANAQGRLNELFEEDAYSIIRNTDCLLAYQIFLLNEIITKVFNEIKKMKKYKSLVSYIFLLLFSLICKSLKEINIKLGKDEITDFLENESKSYNPLWIKIIKIAIEHILEFYAKQCSKVIKNEKLELTYSTFFKNRSYLTNLLENKIPREVLLGLKKIF